MYRKIWSYCLLTLYLLAVTGLDVRAQVFNLTNGRHFFRRTVYDAFRDTGNVFFHEDANQGGDDL